MTSSDQSIHADIADQERGGVQVIDKAADILGALAAQPAGLSASELSQSAGVNRSTTYRILGTLENVRFVKRISDQRYALSLHLFEIGSAVVPRDLALNSRITDRLTQAAEETHLTAFLCITDAGRARFIAQSVYAANYRIPYPAGTSLPLHAGVTGRILLAYLSQADIDQYLSLPLERITKKTPIDPDVLRNILEDIRCSDYYESCDDVTVGVGAIGAPVINRQGDIVASVCLSGLSTDVVGARHDENIAAVRSLALNLSHEIGWKGATLRRARLTTLI